MNIKVLTFNILAQCFVDKKWYPKSIPNKYLSIQYRRTKIINFLQEIKDLLDIIALQEMTGEEYKYYTDLLNKEFYCFFVSHGKFYWKNSFSEDWEPNGNALFIKKVTFYNPHFLASELSDSGNHCIMAICRHKKTKKIFRIASIHFEDSNKKIRDGEMDALNKLYDEDDKIIDIISGDFNSDMDSISKHLKNFNDAIVDECCTHPFATKIAKNKRNIDHVLYKNMELVASEIINNNIWQKYPVIKKWITKDINESNRIIENLKQFGSDHFPIIAEFKFN
jgi:endonuclease/exonuclease/phosphatase family metal-dependent hydrolase